MQVSKRGVVIAVCACMIPFIQGLTSLTPVPVLPFATPPSSPSTTSSIRFAYKPHPRTLRNKNKHPSSDSIRLSLANMPPKASYTSLSDREMHLLHNYLLQKILSDQEASGAASPTKSGEGDDAAPGTPSSKKKVGGRERKTGEFIALALGFTRSQPGLMTGLDAAAGDAAADDEDESPSKKKKSPSKRKGKASQEEAPVKMEAGEGSDENV